MLIPEEPMDDGLRARRARVFREVRAAQRRHNAEVRHEYDALRDRQEARSRTPGVSLMATGVLWAAGVTVATKITPWVSLQTGVPKTAVFSCLGFFLGLAHGASLNVEQTNSRVKHALVLAAIYAAFLGGFVLLWPPNAWSR